MIEIKKCKNCGNEIQIAINASEEKDRLEYYFCKECHGLSDLKRSEKKLCKHCKSKNVEKYTTQKFKCPVCKKEVIYETINMLET